MKQAPPKHRSISTRFNGAGGLPTFDLVPESSSALVFRFMLGVAHFEATYSNRFIVFPIPLNISAPLIGTQQLASCFIPRLSL